MSTKFVSKNSNYCIVLKQGIEGNRAIGTQAIPGVYVRFQDGTVKVSEESMLEQLRNHPKFGTDFLEVKEEEKDPFLDQRVESEPKHAMTEIKYGHVGKKQIEGAPTKMTPQVKKLIEREAIKMLPDLLKANPQILKDIITDMASDLKQPEDKVEPAMSANEIPVPKESQEEIIEPTESNPVETTHIEGDVLVNEEEVQEAN